MTPQLFGHPFSSYTWKALIGPHEAEVAFDFRSLDPAEPEAGARLQALWPFGRFPVLEADDGVWIESSVIVEWADRRRASGPPLIPVDPALALEVRMLDRLCDGYLMTPVQTNVGHRLRPEGCGDAYGAEQARATLATAYAWFDARLERREWLVGDAFSLADASAAPALFYADWITPLGEHPRLAAYLSRLRARPSVRRCVDGARPFRAYFPAASPRTRIERPRRSKSSRLAARGGERHDVARSPRAPRRSTPDPRMRPMHYMLLFNETASERGKRDDPAEAQTYWGGWNAYMGAIAQAGVMVSGNGLQPPEVSTTLRIQDGKRHVVDGPFADTKEMLGGYVILDVDDLDGALEWAARAPCVASGSVEIRPVLPPPAA